MLNSNTYNWLCSPYLLVPYHHHSVKLQFCFLSPAVIVLFTAVPTTLRLAGKGVIIQRGTLNYLNSTYSCTSTLPYCVYDAKFSSILLYYFLFLAILFYYSLHQNFWDRHLINCVWQVWLLHVFISHCHRSQQPIMSCKCTLPCLQVYRLKIS